MPIEFDNRHHADDFIRLNEQWVAEHFSIEDADRRLAADPFKVVENGGHILSLVEDGRVLGVCALFKEGEHRYQLARMAVAPEARGRGYGEQLMSAALAKARQRGAHTVYLNTNTVLAPAIALYRKHGFVTIAEGCHAVYARCNLVMEKTLDPTPAPVTA